MDTCGFPKDNYYYYKSAWMDDGHADGPLVPPLELAMQGRARNRGMGIQGRPRRLRGPRIDPRCGRPRRPVCGQPGPLPRERRRRPDHRRRQRRSDNPTSHESDKASERSAFNGYCQVILQAGDEPGELTLRAQLAGLAETHTIFTAKPLE
jgi:glycosyl hydrolase family 2